MISHVAAAGDGAFALCGLLVVAGAQPPRSRGPRVVGGSRAPNALRATATGDVASSLRRSGPPATPHPTSQTKPAPAHTPPLDPRNPMPTARIRSPACCLPCWRCGRTLLQWVEVVVLRDWLRRRYLLFSGRGELAMGCIHSTLKRR